MPTRTRAALKVTHGQPLAIEEIELPDPGPDEVLVQLYASGVCHTQLHAIHNPAQPMPVLLGHEATGVVVALGRNVTRLREGDRVMASWVPQDPGPAWQRPSCNFRWRGQQYASPPPGWVYTWSEHVLAHEQAFVSLPSDLPTDVTAIVGCAVITGVGAVHGTARVQPGQTIAVFGIGGVGINVIAGGVLAGAERIIAVDLADEKLEFARRFGATDVVNGTSADPVAAIRDLTGGGVDFAFDAIGLPVTARQALESVRPGELAVRRGGTAVIVGITDQPLEVPTRLFPYGERSLIGSMGGSAKPADVFPQYLQWYREGRLPLDAMVTDRYDGLDSINEAVRALESGEIVARGILQYAAP